MSHTLHREHQHSHDHRQHHQNQHSHDNHAHADHHHHDHHSHTRFAAARHALSELFGGHTHDAADQIDDALEADARGRKALWLSLAALALTAAVQAAIVVFTHSVALLGDTLHNFADAATAIPLLVAFWLARRPATDRFTYGYGRAEDLAGIFVVLMIALSSVLAGWEAIDRLLNPRDVHHLWVVAAAGVAGFAGNELVARYRIRVGHQIGSAALVADGLHARTDGFTSLAVVLGAAGVAAGLPWADPVIGLVIALAILAVLRSAVQQVGARLMDAVDPQLVMRARAAISTVEEVVAVDQIRLRWIGHTLHAEAEVTVPGGLSVVDSDAVADHAREHLAEALPRLAAAVIHVGPADQPVAS